MTDKRPMEENSYNISEVSSISGIPKDLLRMWERRYGYPNPVRDIHNDRRYTNQDLEKLVLIRQLLDQGKRPGKLVGQPIEQLQKMLQQPQTDSSTDELGVLLKSHDASALRQWLLSQLRALGLRSFVHKTMVPTIKQVGEAWSRGELAIHEEHLYTEMMKSMVRQAMSVHKQEAVHFPKVMLTTVPGEQHGMGLLMVEALLRLAGAEVIPFGTEMPFKDIQEAAIRHRVDIIGLSFSASFKTEDAVVVLSGLRQMVDQNIEIWAGGEALSNSELTLNGVLILSNLSQLELALADWNNDARKFELN